MSTDSTRATQATVPASRARDVTTVALLVGSVLLLVLPGGLLWAIVAWTVGVGRLWSSVTWDLRDKLLGTLVWPGGLIGPVLLSTMATQVCTQVAEIDIATGVETLGDEVCSGFAFSPWVGVPLALITVAAPLAVAALLLHRARRVSR